MQRFLQTLAAAALAGVALSAFTPAPLVLAAQAIHAGAHAGPEARLTRLTVHLTGAASDQGVIWVGVYADEEAYEAGEELRSANLAVSDGRAEAVFDALPPGDFGIIAFHDENGDGDFTSNFIGIPQERYGFSNNPRPRFRRARWDEALFTLDGESDAVMNIELVGAAG